MRRWELLMPKRGVHPSTLLLSAYNIAVNLAHWHQGCGATILQFRNAHGLLAYWVGLDDEQPPAVADANSTVLAWIAPVECWPTLESLGLGRAPGTGRNGKGGAL